MRQEDIEVPFGTCASADSLQNITSSLCDPVTGQPLEERISSIFGYSFGWDRRNHPITPTRGFDFNFTQDMAGLGGDVQYLRTEARGNVYRGLLPDVIASATFSGGYITGWGGDPVQINDRFFKGSYDFRGYDNLGIGPRIMERRDIVNDDGTVERKLVRGRALGGNAYGILSTEVSFPLGIDALLGSLFVEAGAVGLLDDEFKTFETEATLENDELGLLIVDELSIRAMAGASIFWESPFGPIRFDFTQPLRKFPYDERQSFQFTTRTRF